MTPSKTPDKQGRPVILDILGGDKDAFLDTVPHAKAIGMEIVEIGKASGVLKIPYSEKLIGNPQTGVVHGGVISSLLDTALGLAVICALDELVPIATLDLRIDYMKAATPGQTIYARAECTQMTKTIAFVRGTAYHDTIDDPIAMSVAAFMLKSSSVTTHKLPQQD